RGRRPAHLRDVAYHPPPARVARPQHPRPHLECDPSRRQGDGGRFHAVRGGRVRGADHRVSQGPLAFRRSVTMLGETARSAFQDVLREVAAAGLTKDERIIETPQGVAIDVGGRTLLNFCANNYLGLSSHPEVVAAAHRALDARGYGLSSVRFICGTQDIHKQLEQKLAAFVGMDDAILYGSCFDANGGLFETLLGEDDAVISDALNHASII